MPGKAIGIDLGTTYSCVAVFERGHVEIITNDHGKRVTPSYVAFTNAGRLVGDAAKNQASLNPTNTLFDAKRLIGRRFYDTVVQVDMQHWPFKVVNDKDKPKMEVTFKGKPQQFYPEEISSMVLVNLRETAEAYLGSKVTDAVITVPAYFNDAQRQATRNAGTIAGLNVLRIINEPAAAALAYGLGITTKKHNVLIYDFGGGTFDVSVLTFDGGKFVVKSTAGDSHLGGEDFDTLLVRYFLDEIERKHNKSLHYNKRALRRLRTACERAKCLLSFAPQAEVELDSLFGDGLDFQSSITRARFEDLCSGLFQLTLDQVKKAVADADMTKGQIDEIVMVGGSSRIPKIQHMLQDYFDGHPLNKSVNVDEAVAFGAAVQAAILSGDDSQSLKSLSLTDVIPLSLGIETTGGVMSIFIDRNSTYPITVKRELETSKDNQTKVNFSVYEGERPLTKDNNLLGQFSLEGIPEAPAGVAKIHVRMDIDPNGLLHVTAMEYMSGVEKAITIINQDRLSEEQITGMVRAAEIFAEEDAKKRAEVNARNALEGYVLQLQSTLKFSSDEVESQLSKQERDTVMAQIGDTVKWLDENGRADKVELSALMLLDKLAKVKSVCDPIMAKLRLV